MCETTSMTDKPKLPPYLAAANLIQGEQLVENHNVRRASRLFLVEGTPEEDRFALSRKVDDLLNDVCIADAIASVPLIGDRLLIVYPPLNVTFNPLENGEGILFASWSMH